MSITASGTSGRAQHAVELSVLGAFQARIDGRWVQAPTRQVAKVATVLSGWPGEPVERERIMTAVWGAKPPVTATNTLQVHVSHLRRMLGRDVITSHGNHYRLDVAPEAVDSELFVELVGEAARMRRREHFGRARELLTQALGLWRGTPFADVLEPDLEARRARLVELRDQAREDLIECRLELCRDQIALADVVADAMELVARQPMRERGHAILVRALAAAERPGEASAAFEHAAAHLRATTGLDPGRDLVTVYSRSLHDQAGIYPKAMAALTNVPPRAESYRVKENGHVGLGGRGAACPDDELVSRAHEAIVDLGATLVTVIEADAARRPALATAIGQAIADDLLDGVVVLTCGADPRADLREELARLTGVPLEDYGMAERPHLAVVFCENGVRRSRELLAMLDMLPAPSTLVYVGARQLDAPTEVVITDHRGTCPTPD